ncbi:hypothetical protein [uncultured Jannaschia sp.]|uniref:hypothetical protein n=1 Tax=uncultured Jannaschia sp. TaxID=293347 RepID=UPI0026272251|nr:hypothetical protein [uncultured Jannaschia sp.]
MTRILALTAALTVAATGAFAQEIKPVDTTQSTQGATSLGLGTGGAGLIAAGVTILIVAGIASSSGGSDATSSTP